jgi:protein-disulfide isomerase
VANRHRSMPRALADPRTARVAKRTGHANRVLWFLAALSGVLIAVTVLSAVLVRGATRSRDSRINIEVGALLAGIPQHGQTLGNVTAPVTLQVFAELQDPSSDTWFLTLLPATINKFVRTNRLKIEYHSFKTNALASETFLKQQAAALAAGAQNKLWNYAYTFYHEQGQEYTPYVTESYLDNIARQVPSLNIKRWDTVRNADSRVEQVVEEDQQARAEGIHVTPAYRIGPTGGVLKNFTGSASTTYTGQIHPTTYASAQDITKAIDQMH